MFAPRICGICSVSQSMAAASALADAMGLAPAPNGRITRNLAHAVENVADHFTHFYLFFMPDFARAEYAGRAWHARTAERFRAVRGSAAPEVMPARTAFLSALGTLAGKWPHSLAIQPGGVARALEASEKIRLFALLRDFRRHVETTLFGDELEAVAALDSAAALSHWAGEKPRGDFGAFLGIADDLALETLGRGVGRFMSYGNYPQAESQFLRGGVWDGQLHALDAQAIAEDTSHAWLDGETRHPAQGVTRPQDEKAAGYTWCKAPRLAGLPMETGALARQVVAGHALARDLVNLGGVLHPGRTARRGCRRRDGRSGARQPRPLDFGRGRPHRQLPDRLADHLELLAARRRRHAGTPRAGAGRHAGGRGERRRAACGTLVRPLHGVHCSLR
jgi:hydrogenase large subunit